MEQKRQELLEKYSDLIFKDFYNSDDKDSVMCPEFKHLCIESAPEFAIRVLRSLYEKDFTG